MFRTLVLIPLFVSFAVNAAAGKGRRGGRAGEETVRAPEAREEVNRARAKVEESTKKLFIGELPKGIAGIAKTAAIAELKSRPQIVMTYVKETDITAAVATSTGAVYFVVDVKYTNSTGEG